MDTNATAVLQLRINKLADKNYANMTSMLNTERLMNQAIADGLSAQARGSVANTKGDLTEASIYSVQSAGLMADAAIYLQQIKDLKKLVENSTAEMDQMIITLLLG